MPSIDVNRLHDGFRQQGYVADPDLMTALSLMDALQKPLLVEGEAGVGKTELARTLAACHGCRLIRLQCYEGLDAQHALYDWDYRRQLLAIQMVEADQRGSLSQSLYGEDYLVARPILAALQEAQPPVLLIDEIDRADEEFEALLLEVLADFQITIPEFGTVTARSRPRVILTSNGVRELSDALRRRCLYHYIEYPSAEIERQIVRARLPGIDEHLLRQLVTVVQRLREQQLRKAPGVAETLDWAAALMSLGVHDLAQGSDAVRTSLACLLKTHEDQTLIQARRDASPDTWFMESVGDANPAEDHARV